MAKKKSPRAEHPEGGPGSGAYVGMKLPVPKAKMALVRQQPKNGQKKTLDPEGPGGTLLYCTVPPNNLIK